MNKIKLILFLAFAIFVSFCLQYFSLTMRKTQLGLPPKADLGYLLGSKSPLNNSIDQPKKAGQMDPESLNWNLKPTFSPGSLKNPDYNYTTVLVVASINDENTSWMDMELSDLEKAVYVADNPTAPLHPPMNKGHEVMIYLSWIIDKYHSLPDIAIFMHAHQFTWHNDEILDHNAGELIRRLSKPRVWREGFVNMRCSWYPGCPDWMHPGETTENINKQEEIFLAKSWTELFPLEEIPTVLAQPCCAQFALSRERILARSRSEYGRYRQWLLSTQLPDSISGRVWEYFWQFVFTGNNIYCPLESICYCDQYGICFGGEDKLNEFVTLKRELGDKERDLREVEEKGSNGEELGIEDHLQELDRFNQSETERRKGLKQEIERMQSIVRSLRADAIERGKDPKIRASEAGRDWKEGDGF